MPENIIAVTDINVFVSGATTSVSYPAQVMDLWRGGAFQLAMSEPILDRMRQVFTYPKVARYTGYDAADIDEFIAEVRASSIAVPGMTQVDISPDPEDNALFSCVIEAKAHYIVSGDKQHVLSVGLYRGIRTASPRQFVEAMAVQTQAA